MIRVLAITMFVIFLTGCTGAGYYIDPSAMISPAYTIEPEIVREKVTIVWHRVTREQLSRLSDVFVPLELRTRISLGGMALPGPNEECHIFASEVAQDPSSEARTFSHEILHCFNGAYHSNGFEYSTGVTWQGLSSPWISRYYLSLALAAVEGRPLPEPPPPEPDQAASSGCGE